MKIIIHQKMFALLLTVFFICLSLDGKTMAQENAFASVPDNLRARLIERLQLLVDYQRNRQWSNHYDLLVSDITDKISKENYIKEQQRLDAEKLGDVLVDFKVQTATYATGAPFDVYIRGCGVFRQGNRTVKLQSGLEAYREKGDWYFIRISPDVPIDGDAPFCLPNNYLGFKLGPCR